MLQRLGRHAPLAAVLAVAAALVFVNLDREHLWADEGDTAVLAKSVLKYGVPTAWDGTTFTDSDFGARLTDNFVMVSHPWLQYYVTAASFALFGETTLAARLPFALFGLATIAIVYFTLVRVTGNRWAAISAAVLLTLSVQFLLYARQSRHYTLNAALTCLLVMQFTRLNSRTNSLIFALVAILLFHSHPIAVAPLAALGLLTLTYEPCRQYRRWFWQAAPVIAIFTAPWFLLARAGYEENVVLLGTLDRFVPRLAQFGIEVASVTSLLGAAALALFLKRRRTPTAPRRPERARRRRPIIFTVEERSLVVILLTIVAAYGVVVAVTLSRDVLWTMGIRNTPAVIPFVAMLAGLVIAKASRANWRTWAALILVFGFTKLARPTPWTFWQEPTAMFDPASTVTFHVPPNLVDRVFRTGQVAYVQSLVTMNPGTTGRVAEFLQRNAGPRDIVITNYAWEPLYFHTGLPQGMKILPDYPIYDAARERRLPAYVFGVDGARWIVWRRAWGNYRGQECGQILEALAQAGVPATLVASIPETMWENRENVHFRRFAGDRYIYPWYGEMPDTLIYRVDWPGTPIGGGSRELD
jgi:hypothetical protein